ncbi:hypothetical protein ABT127_29475 [Streptomyces sp. NPDC001904]|uniref:hypothetical protein n=1 Tax=Streptomyces sp. NPDC001904 TaxID=3154531 RepID=UPI00332EEC17
MTITLSLLIVSLLLVAFALRNGHVRIGSAVSCALFGFAVAGTTAGPIVTSTIGALFGVLSHIG